MTRKTLKATDIDRIENTSFASALLLPDAGLAEAGAGAPPVRLDLGGGQGGGDTECSCACRLAICSTFVCGTGVNPETWYQNTLHTLTFYGGDTLTVLCESYGPTTLELPQ